MATDWSIAESASVPKTGPDTGPGEDRLLVRDDDGLVLVAVIDGATDKAGRRYEGRTGGELAADCVEDTLRHALLPVAGGPAGLVAAITAGLTRTRHAFGVDPDDPVAPSAVAAVFLPEQEIVVRVGDVHLALRRGDAWQQMPAHKEIDDQAAHIRAAHLTRWILGGTPEADLAANDPGRELILPRLVQQHLFANRPGGHPLAFGVLDGRTEVPPEFVEVFDTAGADEVVLATDGYLAPHPTLAEAEQQLRASLLADPLRIGTHPATKGVTPGNVSFDDRIYLRAVRHSSRQAGAPRTAQDQAPTSHMLPASKEH
ncbi:protein phosphatase 2C domain-containing protein [Kitasatospora sp. NPDC051984]|uniref:protein phosphatase 2C domain-containing protein n=1 Tax=Kitasatospora sp. NPDC051984 TaxID=3364059 RepID=UPI0037CC0F0E